MSLFLLLLASQILKQEIASAVEKLRPPKNRTMVRSCLVLSVTQEISLYNAFEKNKMNEIAERKLRGFQIANLTFTLILIRFNLRILQQREKICLYFYTQVNSEHVVNTELHHRYFDPQSSMMVSGALFSSCCLAMAMWMLTFAPLSVGAVNVVPAASNPDLCETADGVRDAIFLFDLSGSIRGKKQWITFNPQRLYAQRVLQLYQNNQGSTRARFALSAYSRKTADVKSLTNKRSSDIPFMISSISTAKRFQSNSWDNPRNGYSILTKKGMDFLLTLYVIHPFISSWF